jgi:hypothetical protein
MPIGGNPLLHGLAGAVTLLGCLPLNRNDSYCHPTQH